MTALRPHTKTHNTQNSSSDLRYVLLCDYHEFCLSSMQSPTIPIDSLKLLFAFCCHNRFRLASSSTVSSLLRTKSSTATPTAITTSINKTSTQIQTQAYSLHLTQHLSYVSNFRTFSSAVAPNTAPSSVTATIQQSPQQEQQLRHTKGTSILSYQVRFCLQLYISDDNTNMSIT